MTPVTPTAGEKDQGKINKDSDSVNKTVPQDRI